MSRELGYGDGGNTVVVGVKMDAPSRELLTWALVKVAEPGDLVIALHVLGSNEIVDPEGKSSLLSLVKAFDSVLAVYEGFCNLKQVDLKLKICRGSSIGKIIVREANSYTASKVIVGTAAKRHAIRSSTSVAKYCARKVPNYCSVLAVRNGKVVFQREAPAEKTDGSKGLKPRENGVLEAFERLTIAKQDEIDMRMMPNGGCDQRICEDGEQIIPKADAESTKQQKCTICFPDTIPLEGSQPCANTKEESNVKGDVNNSMALVLLQKLEAASSSPPLSEIDSPELKPGWPLLQHSVLSSAHNSPSSSHDGSVGQHPICCEQQDGQKDAIVPIGTEVLLDQASNDQTPDSLPRELENLHEKYSSMCKLFMYNELQEATSCFMPGNLIGKGGNSQVYRGSLPDGKELAIKNLKPTEDVLQEFISEIEIITGLNHKNIISLFGFCFEDNHFLLVYDLLPRGSLEENLHGSRKDSVAFGWNERFMVALGVAEALHYLHNHITQPVIHGDVKSSNILLSEDFEPQLSDFGLAKLTSTSSHISCTDVAGTFGYLAPEYFMYGKVTDKIDVYAFGVVLLELLSGRKPISSEHPKGQESLVMWAKPILNGGKVSKLLDPCMSSDYNRDQMERMVLAATLCIRRAPRARPQMSLVLKLLGGDIEVLKWARLQVNASEKSERLDEDDVPQPDLQSHLSLALLDIEDDSLSISSIEQHMSLEDYLRGRWSRSSSFD